MPWPFSKTREFSTEASLRKIAMTFPSEAFIWIEETRTIKLSGFYFAEFKLQSHHGFKIWRRGGFLDFFTKEEETDFKNYCEKKFYTSNVKNELRIPMSRNCDLYSFGLIALQVCETSSYSIADTSSV